MAQLTVERFNQVEWSKKLHNGEVLPEVEMLAQDNGADADALWEQTNDNFTHLYSQVVAMPTMAKTAWGEGTAASKSTTAQETEPTALLTGLAEIESELYKVGGKGAILMAKEDARFMEVAKQESAKLRWYGNRASNIKDYDGLATRFNALTGVKSKNVFNCEGATANAQTSILGLVWGANAYCIFPKGTTAGYSNEAISNGGIYPKTLPSGKTMLMRGTVHRLHTGLVLETWQAGGRICNIDVAAALALSGNQAISSVKSILHMMLRLKARLDRIPGKRVFYANDTVLTLLMRLGLEKSANGLSLRDAATQFGTTTKELHFHDYVIRRDDQILDSEAVVA